MKTKESLLEGALFLERIILIPIMLVIFAVLVLSAVAGIGVTRVKKIDWQLLAISAMIGGAMYFLVIALIGTIKYL